MRICGRNIFISRAYAPPFYGQSGDRIDARGLNHSIDVASGFSQGLSQSRPLKKSAQDSISHLEVAFAFLLTSPTNVNKAQPREPRTAPIGVSAIVKSGKHIR